MPQAKTSATLEAMQGEQPRRRGTPRQRRRSTPRKEPLRGALGLWLCLLWSCATPVSAHALEPTVLPIAWHVVEDAAG
ncbi:MAG TPA: hypothetical protein VK509_09725, partial [Polyangiales bacterium]|nr:hypothetical protein [Polyangiales bacterium]